MPKIKLGDMTYADKKEYQYYKRVIGDLNLYGPHLFEKIAREERDKIEKKYARSESNAKN